MNYRIYICFGVLCICTLFVYVLFKTPLLGKLHQILDSEFPCQPDTRFSTSEWYDKYATLVHSVHKLPSCEGCIHHAGSVDAQRSACAAWWHSTPQRNNRDYPLRNWSGVLRPKNQTIPKCQFGQLLIPQTKCSTSQRRLFEALDRLRVVYFPRSGTELGIVRGSAYLSQDGDLDIFVDMPQQMLYPKLKKMLDPAPHMDGNGVPAEVHWGVAGCPEVHMVYNDVLSDKLQHRAQPEDLCSCRLNSVELLCHRSGQERMYTQYGPSWRLPLGVKSLDMPYWAFTHKNDQMNKGLVDKLKGMINATTGRIEGKAVGAIVDQPVLEDDMALILAQLNVMAGGLDLIAARIHN